MTFQELDTAAYALQHGDAVYQGVNDIMAHADDNAQDGAGKMASLESLLCYCEDSAVIAWFADRGVTF